ncbi:uncharacterized protein BDW47DRAFT_99445 [Aspergillus candidus]|uniref:Rhodopsin domain-containing protein n=1 Tax=Aspergillus candidus TaxID=41067 RepID=A0A2I2FM05_ASPCN|nr:hypothetical protein BDW47DRAFT_99445 [Aspergillus candidus]PLB41640.1 hypothetical protein BDW47DRAFT_99445 [Aspergillus candidus]
METPDLATTPGMPPPAGQVPQFDSPYNSLQIGTFIAFGITIFLATVVLALRYFQAVKLIKKIEMDLVTVTISYGVSVYYFVSMHELMGYGWGKHTWDVSLLSLMKFNQALLPNTLSYIVCPCITKMAILSVLYRINPAFAYRAAVVSVAVMIFAYTLTLCVITGGPCSPLKDGTIECLQNVALSQAALNIASDFAVMILPLPTIMNLHFSRKKKITAGCLLTLGSAVTVCSIARLPYVIKLSKDPDVSYTEAILGIWSVVEVNLGIICACSMRLKQLLRVYLPQLGPPSSNPPSGKLSTYESWGNRFRPDGGSAQHSYQLHSVQNSSVDPCVGSKDIAVSRTFNMDVEDRGSTDKILR